MSDLYRPTTDVSIDIASSVSPIENENEIVHDDNNLDILRVTDSSLDNHFNDISNSEDLNGEEGERESEEVFDSEDSNEEGNNSDDIIGEEEMDVDLDLLDTDISRTRDLQSVFDTNLTNYTNNALEVFSEKNLFQELRHNIDTTTITCLRDSFIRSTPKHSELVESFPSNEISNKFNNYVIEKLRNCISEVKRQLKFDFQQLQASEEKIQNCLDNLEDLKRQSCKLEDFYSILDNPELEEKFRQLAKQAYADKTEKIQLPKYLDKYKSHLDLHLQNVNCLRKINCLNSVPLCSLCLEKEINHVAIPCGHTFCQDCLGKCTSCSFCRSIITDRQKIFIG